MKLKDMKVMGRYVVTKGGTTLDVGDHVFRDSKDSIVCEEAEGWLVKGEWERLRNEVEIDVDWYQRRAQAHRRTAMDMELRLSQLLKYHRKNG